MKVMSDVKKQKEWRQWGKEGFKGARSMMRNNSHHPDYDTPEKVEAQLDNYRGWVLAPDRLKTQFGYDDEDCAEAEKHYKAGFDASRKWYKREDAKYRAVLDKYAPIFREAEEIAAKVDVSDIQDGFPCGWAHLYLQQYPEAEDLYEALGHFNGDTSECYKRQLPIKMPKPGQCIAYDERYCAEVNKFLRTKGIFASVKSVID